MDSETTPYQDLENIQKGLMRVSQVAPSNIELLMTKISEEIDKVKKKLVAEVDT